MQTHALPETESHFSIAFQSL